MEFFTALIVAVALSFVSALLMPKPKQPKPPAATDMDSPTADAGRPIPVTFGTVTTKGVNVIWFGEKRIHTYKVKA